MIVNDLWNTLRISDAGILQGYDQVGADRPTFQCGCKSEPIETYSSDITPYVDMNILHPVDSRLRHFRVDKHEITIITDILPQPLDKLPVYSQCAARAQSSSRNNDIFHRIRWKRSVGSPSRLPNISGKPKLDSGRIRKTIPGKRKPRM